MGYGCGFGIVVFFAVRSECGLGFFGFFSGVVKMEEERRWWGGE